MLDLLGANSMCPYYYSVREDGTRQDYRSVPVWCIPPYKEMDAFVFTLERAQHADATTQAILVIPRTHFSDLESLVARNLWTRVDYYHKSSRNFFSRPDKTSIFGPNRRTLHSTVQHISLFRESPGRRMILKLGTHSFRTLTLSHFRESPGRRTCVPWSCRQRSLLVVPTSA